MMDLPSSVLVRWCGAAKGPRRPSCRRHPEGEFDENYNSRDSVSCPRGHGFIVYFSTSSALAQDCQPASQPAQPSPASVAAVVELVPALEG